MSACIILPIILWIAAWVISCFIAVRSQGFTKSLVGFRLIPMLHYTAWRFLRPRGSSWRFIVEFLHKPLQIVGGIPWRVSHLIQSFTRWFMGAHLGPYSESPPRCASTTLCQWVVEMMRVCKQLFLCVCYSSNVLTLLTEDKLLSIPLILSGFWKSS